MTSVTSAYTVLRLHAYFLPSYAVYIQTPSSLGLLPKVLDMMPRNDVIMDPSRPQLSSARRVYIHHSGTNSGERVS